MLCAEVISRDTDTARAAQSIGVLLRERLQKAPDLLVLFATHEHADRFERVRDEIAGALGAKCVLGCTAAGLIGGGHEHEDGPGLAAFAIACDGAIVEPFHATVEPTGEQTAEVHGFPYDRLRDVPAATALFLGDPFSFPADPVVRSTAEQCPGVPLVGGLASGGPAPGANRLIANDKIVTDGAVGVVLGGTVGVDAFVSQGCRPVGRHFVITKGRENVIEELGGASALSRLEEVLATLSEYDRGLFSRAVHLGRVTDEYKSEYGPGDFLVRSVIGIHRQRGGISINDFIRRGQSVQFMIRDPRAAGAELEAMIESRARRGAADPIQGALLFTCNGRGSGMFGTPDHDVSRVRRLRSDLPVAGFFAAGEIGPVGGSNYLHGYSASLALFRRREPIGTGGITPRR